MMPEREFSVCLQVHQNVDLVVSDRLGRRVVIHIGDADDAAPFDAVSAIHGDVLFRGGAIEGRLEAAAIVLFQHALKQAHGGMVVPQIAGDIADAQSVTPAMRHGPAPRP